jgi:hypothetical protein
MAGGPAAVGVHAVWSGGPSAADCVSPLVLILASPLELSGFGLIPAIKVIAVVDEDPRVRVKLATCSEVTLMSKQLTDQAILSVAALGAELPECINRGRGIHIVVEPLLERP